MSALAARCERRGSGPRLGPPSATPSPSTFQRDRSERLSCPVRDTYGMAEIVSAASECASGALHLWPEVGVTEWVARRPTSPSRPGEGGRVCTGLLNLDMPLIRYGVGDRATRVVEEPGMPVRPPASNPRSRGRSFLRRSPHSRGTARRSAGHDISLRASDAEAQIVQETSTRIRIRWSRRPGSARSTRRISARGVQSRIGKDVDVDVVTVDNIPRTSAGSFESRFPCSSTVSATRSRGQNRGTRRKARLDENRHPHPVLPARDLGAPQARLSHLAGQLVAARPRGRRCSRRCRTLSAAAAIVPGLRGPVAAEKSRDGVTVVRCGLSPDAVNVRAEGRGSPSYFSIRPLVAAASGPSACRGSTIERNT